MHIALQNARCSGGFQANKDDFVRINANNRDKRRITANKDESQRWDRSVVDIRLCSSLIVLSLQPQAALSEGRKPLGGVLFGSVFTGNCSSGT
jgi:hypothetical protein